MHLNSKVSIIGMVGILSLSGQNRHPSTEHDQNQFSGGSSTCYREIVQQTNHPQGKMGEVTGNFFTKQ